MRRARALVVACFALVAAVAACSDLFDDAQQCTVDRDCEKFGAVCDVAHGVCVVPGAGDDGGVESAAVDAPAAPPDADAPFDPCDLPNKPTQIVGGSAFDAGFDGGDALAITGAVTLDCSKDWILRGRVFVPSGATLTIQAGTTIRGEKATMGELVVLAGGRILAAGTRDKPIVFTSDQAAPAPSDWGGLFVLGSAPPANGLSFYDDPAMPYGGANADDDSGNLEFVRIEYGNLGLVLAGVGNKTKIDSVEVRRNGDNCFSFFGGTFDAKHLVCQSPGDEFFELGDGYAGRLQFLFGHAMRAGSSETNGFLTDGASPVVYNATLCGSSQTDPNYGLVVRNASKLDMSNAIFTGWFAGVDFRQTTTTPTELRSSIAFGNATNPAYVEDAEVTDDTSPYFNDDEGFDEVAWFRDAARGNLETDPKLVACGDAKSPRPFPASSLAQGARTPPADGFFNPSAAFVGAFRDATDAWMTGAWVRFDDK